MIYSNFTRCLLSVFLTVAIIGLTVQAQQEASVPPITYEDASYGDHPNHVIDFWKADVNEPAPLVIFIHGDGFKGGSHEKVSGNKIQQYLDAGIHHASVEYRFIKHAQIPAPHENAVRALQFIRSKADDWGIDKNPSKTR